MTLAIVQNFLDGPKNSFGLRKVDDDDESHSKAEKKEAEGK